MEPQSPWVEEALVRDLAVRYRITAEIASCRTPYQTLRLVQTARFGRMLLLDGLVQTTEADEFIYHEMLTHVPLCSLAAPSRVLVIGGGDGGIVREVLRHPCVARVVLVEIDRQVIDFCTRHLPSLHQGAFDDPRVEVVIADGARHVRETSERFDVVIVDSSDPVGPAQVLYSAAFYRDIQSVLAPGGVLVRQTGSTFLQPEEQRQAVGILRTLFARNALYLFTVPTYAGGAFSCVFSSDETDPAGVSDALLEDRCGRLTAPPRYYSPAVHRAAFCLPGHIRSNLDG